ncbi:hypothetical protein [Methanosalsum zhilinae]|nr:hypothetical protein [Methanosalsum zhilinae]
MILEQSEIKNIADICMQYFLFDWKHDSDPVVAHSMDDKHAESCSQKIYRNIIKNKMIARALLKKEKDIRHIGANVTVEYSGDMCDVTCYLSVAEGDTYSEVIATGVYRPDLENSDRKFQLRGLKVFPGKK